MLIFKAKQASARLRRTEVLTSGSVNVHEVLFEFEGDKWEGLTRIAQFRAGNVIKSWILTEDNVCVIPWEVLITPNLELEIGVLGMLGEETILPTVWVDAGIIREGAGGGEESLPPTPSLYEQLLKMIGNLEELETSDKSSLVAAINEIYRTGGGGSGEQGTIDHNKLINRDLANQHPISAIEGLTESLNNKLDKSNLGENLEINPEGKLQVKMAKEMEEDNTLPISSAEVYKQVGNINALLATI